MRVVSARPQARTFVLLISLLALLLPVLAIATPTAQAGPAQAGPPTAAAAQTDLDPGVVGRLLAPLRSLDLGAFARPTVRPRTYSAGRLDLAGARALLAPAGERRVRISLPAPDGTPVQFDVVEDSVMEPALQARHPELRAYAGVGVTDPTDRIRLDLSPLGLHAVVHSLDSRRTWYVDPAGFGRGITAHLSYLASALPRHDQHFEELEVVTPTRAARRTAKRDDAERRAGEVVVERTYRMAFVTTPSYAEFFGTENVLAVKQTQINRTNAIYNDDMAIKFVLVDGTEDLNLDTMAKATEANGPCGANPCFAADEIESCGGSGIDRNNFVAGQIVGADNFDIGHLGSGAGSGGVAYLGVVGTDNKAGGCTALDTPTGDFYTIDYFAHEVGHQMGGNHTFDGLNGSCAAPNRNADTSVEPGSGSSVMAYAGICLNDDLQPHTDPYFSQRTIDEFTAVVTAEPEAFSEQQVVNLAGLDTGDSFTLTYPGAAAPQVITQGTNYTVAGLEAALLALTGKAVDVTPYDGANALSAAGFTATWPDTVDAERLAVTATTGGVSAFVGVIVNGGPGTNQGGTTVTTDNHRPVVQAGEDKTIPVQTPFTLTGSATDADAGQQAGLTYLWEQNDAGLPGDPILGTGPGQALGSSTRLAGPLFRVFGTAANVTPEDSLMYESPGQNLAGTDPSRTFPDIEQVLANNTNAEGNCPAATSDPTSQMNEPSLECFSELLPTPLYAASLFTAGEMNFRLTVRDGDPEGGGTGYDDVTLTVDPTVGPFLVSSREEAGTPATAGTAETVTWDVAGTDGEGFAENVKISVSLDGGETFPYVVEETTPNDGTEEITLPPFNSTEARIKVEAIGNYFFDVNNADFTITGGEEPPVEAPDTTITGGLKPGGWVVGYTAQYTFTSDTEGATFRCRVDGITTPCADGEANLKNLRPGPHVFTVAAVKDGVVDETPAGRRLFVVYNERILDKATSKWREAKPDSAYRGTIYVTKVKGQKLTLALKRVSKVALLVNKAPGFGTVTVSLGSRKLKTISLTASSNRRRVLVPIAVFDQPVSGKLTITTTKQKTVQIDGIGLVEN